MSSVWKKLVLFLTGFCLYVTIEVCFRGISYPLMGMLGGFAVIIIDKFNDFLSWDVDLVTQCFFGSCVITLMEFIIGEIMINSPLLPIMWDYSNLAFNYKGIICLKFSIFWMILSVVAIFIADAINYYVFEDTDTPHYTLFGIIKFSFVKKKCEEIK